MIENYFRAEKAESLIFITVGILGLILAGIALLKWRDPLSKGFAIPVLLIALIQIGVGASIVLRTDKQSADLVAAFQTSPQAFASTELTRMDTVNKSFVTYRYVEMAFVLAGIALFAFLSQDFWKGLGIGLCLQGAIMLSADLFAEKRAALYTAELRAISGPSAAP